MRAIVIHQFGDPKNLKVEQVPTPQPQRDEVLISIRAASINPSDLKNIEGKMHGTILPRIPGRDFAGVVEKGPADLIGKEVWGSGGDIGINRDGSHAEFVLLPRNAIAMKPTSLSMEAAGSSPLSFVTAWMALVTTANLSAGETAVIIGAAGGVGSAAVQIAKSRGAHVMGVVRDDANIADVRQAGAADVINSKSANLIDAVKSMTKDHGANVVFDSSGMMVADSVEIAALQARLPIIAAPADGKASFNLRTLYRKTLRVFGVDTMQLDAIACAKLLTAMQPQFDSGQFTAKPARRWALDDAAGAYAEAAKGGARIVLVP